MYCLLILIYIKIYNNILQPIEYRSELGIISRGALHPGNVGAQGKEPPLLFLWKNLC